MEELFSALENDKVVLKPLTASDYDVLFQVASDKEIWAQHPDYTRYQPEGFAVYFDKLLETDMPYLIIEKSSQQIIGATSYYQYKPEESKIAIGFTFLAIAYWGGLFNKSIKTLMLEHAFHFVDKVVFHVREKNFRSQGALVKLGAIKVDEYPAPAEPNSIQYEYVLSKTTWEA